MPGRKKRARPQGGGARRPRKLYRIGEITRFTGLTRQSIHRYATLGLLTEEERTESGHRLFGEGVFDVLRRIETLKRTKTLEEIAEILRPHPRTQ